MCLFTQKVRAACIIFILINGFFIKTAEVFFLAVIYIHLNGKSQVSFKKRIALPADVVLVEHILFISKPLMFNKENIAYHAIFY